MFYHRPLTRVAPILCARLLKGDQTVKASSKDTVGGSSQGWQWWKVLWKMKTLPGHESFCESCGAQSEDLFHVAVECTWAKRFWEAVRELMGLKLPCFHKRTWKMDLLAGAISSSEEAAVFVCSAW